MMVLAILLETTYPILLLRRRVVVCSAIYFFSDLLFDAAARDLPAVPLALAALPAAFLATGAAGASAGAAAFCCAAPLRTMPSSRSRKIVLTRAMSLRSPRIFFRL